MSTPTNSVEFCRFINELGDDFYFEDYADDLWAELWDFDDKSKLWIVKPGKADREFVIENDFGGYIAWQGKGPDPYNGTRNTEFVFQEWRKAQTTKTVVVVVPNDKVDSVIAALGNLGLNPILHG